MALMQRVATLIRANLNDLIDQAEEPEKMLKQVMLDMQNQLRQVKTQVAMAIADQHLLSKKLKEQEEKAAEWTRKAEFAVGKEQDDLARAAIEKSMLARTAADSFGQQHEQQSGEVENLKRVLRQLQGKLAEAQTKCDVLAAQHRRARAVGKASEALGSIADGPGDSLLERVKNQVASAEAVGLGKSEISRESPEHRLAMLEKNDRVEEVLAELKARRT
jgi:phage shock protein A